MQELVVVIKHTDIEENEDDYGYYQNEHVTIEERRIKETDWGVFGGGYNAEKTFKETIAGLADCNDESHRVEVVCAYVVGKYDIRPDRVIRVS